MAETRTISTYFYHTQLCEVHTPTAVLRTDASKQLDAAVCMRRTESKYSFTYTAVTKHQKWMFPIFLLAMLLTKFELLNNKLLETLFTFTNVHYMEFFNVTAKWTKE